MWLALSSAAFFKKKKKKFEKEEANICAQMQDISLPRKYFEGQLPKSGE